MSTQNDFPLFLDVIGYSGDYLKGETPSIHKNCQIRDREYGLVLNDCDMSRGASGGPALSFETGDVAIFGIQVSERRGNSTESLELLDYSKEFANIVIPSVSFYQKYLDLQAE